MNYAEQQRNPVRTMVGFAAVVLFHVVLIWALVNGLGKNIVDVIKAPLETKIIKDTKPPPPEAPPPPPPQLAAPPPPYVPPPDIQIQPPPQATTNAITAVTHEAPPTTTFVPTPKPAPPTPDRDVSAVPISGDPATYPPEMQDEDREGRVTVSCDVDATGTTSNCSVEKVVGGEAFARAALQYVRSERYHPATHNGVAIATRHTWVLNYKLGD
jgi:protein TonB